MNLFNLKNGFSFFFFFFRIFDGLFNTLTAASGKDISQDVIKLSNCCESNK